MKADKEMIAGYEKEAEHCIRCGFCQSACPVYEATFRPSYNGRGRMLLLREVMEGTIPICPEVAGSFYTCTTCQACTYSCPAKIKVVDAVQAMRRRLYEEGMTPGPLMSVRNNVLSTGNIYASPQEGRTEVYPPSLKEKATKRAARAETLLFMGCVPSYLDMKMVPSLIRCLDAAGVNYTLLGVEEICCGLPLHLMGSSEFESHAASLIDRIRSSGARELVTPCAGCYKTFKEIYPRIGDLNMEVCHSVQYIDKLMTMGKLELKRGLGEVVTYHDPCDLGRGLKVLDEPRNILRRIPGLKLAEMARSGLQARCCGGGGGLQANDQEIARWIGTQRVRDALEVGATIIVSGCAACKDNLRKGAAKIPRNERGKIKVMDITEMVVNALN